VGGGWGENYSPQKGPATLGESNKRPREVVLMHEDDEELVYESTKVRWHWGNGGWRYSACNRSGQPDASRP
jgi:hypothetical protein